MKLIKWLLSNIILIAFVLALTYAYVYWDNLTGEDTPAGKAIAYLSVEYDEVREFMDSYDFGSDEAGSIVEPEPVAEATETASVPQAMPPPRPQTRPPAQQQPIPQQAMTQQPPVRQAARPQAPQQAMTQQPPVRQAARPQIPPQAMTQQPPVRQAARPQIPPQAMTQQPPVRQAARPQIPPQAMMQPPPAMQPMTPGPEPMPIPSDPAAATAADKPASSTRELWISAREEYYRGNIDASISNYQQVIANTNDNYDAYGELGNVYLSRGNNKEAANAYFEAASILVRQGHVGRARSLLPMLERLDRSKAEALNQLISASNT